LAHQYQWQHDNICNAGEHIVLIYYAYTLKLVEHFASNDDTTVTALVITAMKEFAARRKSGSKK